MHIIVQKAAWAQLSMLMAREVLPLLDVYE